MRASSRRRLSELIAAGEKLKAKGIIPLAFGGQPNWEHSLFRAVLVGHGGPDLFRRSMAVRPERREEPKFKSTAELFAKLRGLVDPGSPGRNWNDATALVITNKAACSSWATGRRASSPPPARRRTRNTAAPSSARARQLVIGGDVFVFPATKDKAQLATQDKLVRGPARPDDPDRVQQEEGLDPGPPRRRRLIMDACAQKAHAVLADAGNQVEAMELLSTPNFSGAMQDAVTQYWNTPSMTVDAFVGKVVAAMRDAT